MLDFVGVDGDRQRITSTEFLEHNPESRDVIARLRVGQTHRGGGGARPEWSIRRVR